MLVLETLCAKRKVPLQVINVNDRLDIIEQGAGNGNNGGAGNLGGAVQVAAVGGRTDGEVLAYIQRMQQGFDNHLQAIRNEQTNFRQWATEQFSRVVRAQRRYGGTIPSALVRQDRGEQARRNRHETAAAIQAQQEANQAQRTALPPIQRNGADLDAALVPMVVTPRAQLAFIPMRSISPSARLMENIRSLSDMWEEYRMGHSDYKAAKDFTGDEINGQGVAFKNKYSRRMKIWRVQRYLVDQGFDIATANGMIARAYGTDKPTPLIVCIQQSQKNPNWPFVGSQRFHPTLVARNGRV
jgi:hypothetical protein